ncbi:hypothetical protein V8E52_000029 [Russula decolorans]
MVCARARDIAYEKHVAARFTIDGWTTVSEVPARYTVPAPLSSGHIIMVTTANGTGSRSASPSSFMRYAGPSSHSRAHTLLLAVPFTAPGTGEWWDKNGGNNFHVVHAHASAGSRLMQ